jgi:hypothetical protein
MRSDDLAVRVAKSLTPSDGLPRYDVPRTYGVRSYFVYMAFFGAAVSGAAGEIEKVTHVLQVFARFSVSSSLYPLTLR